MHAGDGRLIAEFAKERRIYVPVQVMPKLVINAFLAAEDQHFYEHNGIDFQGIARAIVNNITKNKKEGASTITQQVAKNFLLTSEQTFMRKAKEAILAIRIDRAFTKDQILDLYLNQIYLGAGAYGVAAAGLRYFGKELHELEIQEAAYLAALPKEPSKFQLTTARGKTFQDALARRNAIIDNMVRFKYIAAGKGNRQEDAAGDEQQADWAVHLRRGIFCRGGAPVAGRYLRPGRERSHELKPLYGRLFRALDAQPGSAADGARRVPPRARQFDRKHGGWRGPVARSTSPMASGAPSLPKCQAWRMSIRGTSGLCCNLRRTRLSSACSRASCRTERRARAEDGRAAGKA